MFSTLNKCVKNKIPSLIFNLGLLALFDFNKQPLFKTTNRIYSPMENVDDTFCPQALLFSPYGGGGCSALGQGP